jgi:hypothetical protein
MMVKNIEDVLGSILFMHEEINIIKLFKINLDL